MRPDTPFRFWCNDDDDYVGTDEDDRVPVVQPDSQDNQIAGRRDLEDYASLHINIGGLQDAIANGTIEVGLEWRNIEPVEGSSASIKVYQAAESDGGMEYIENSDEIQTWATRQVSPRYRPFIDVVEANRHSSRFPSWFWEFTPEGLHAFDADHANRYLLFEGVTKGRGQLVLAVWKGTGKLALTSGGSTQGSFSTVTDAQGLARAYFKAE